MKNTNDISKYRMIVDIKWLPYALSVIGAYGLSLFFGLSTTNQFTVIFALLLFPLFKNRYSKEYIPCAESVLCAALIATFTVLASVSSIPDRPFDGVEKSYLLIGGIAFFFFYEALFYKFYCLIKKKSFCDENIVVTKNEKLKVFFVSMIIILLMWLPLFLYAYPGILTSDSNSQLYQAAGLLPYSNHHPILHTLIIKLFWDLGHSIFNNSDTAAIVLYSVFQQIALAACFAFVIETLYESKVKKRVLLGALAFYIIPAYHGIYSVTMWKDILFGGVLAVITALIWRLLNKEKKFKLSFLEGMMLLIISVLMCLFRSNGLYAFILLLPGAYFVFFKRNKMTVIIMVLAFVGSLIIKGPIYNSFKVKPVDTIESLSIPAQCIANVAKNPENLNAEQKELLNCIIDIDRINDEYYPFISDNIKILVREKGNQEYLVEHKKEYINLLCELGIKYPYLYLEAYVNQTVGYWYPDVQYWVVATGRDISDFNIPTEEKKNFFIDVINDYVFSYKSMVFLGLFWSIGFAVWVFIIMAGAVSIRHSKSRLLVFLPVLGVYITLLIATPVYSEFRYIYSLFTSMPIFCIIPFVNSKNDNVKLQNSTC